MGRPKEPRYEVSRIHETDQRKLYLADATGKMTYHTGGFNGRWTDGLPGTFTLHVATTLRTQLNAQLAPDLEPLMDCGLASAHNLWTVEPAAR